jgi:hypothetical protein
MAESRKSWKVGIFCPKKTEIVTIKFHGPNLKFIRIIEQPGEDKKPKYYNLMDIYLQNGFIPGVNVSEHLKRMIGDKTKKELNIEGDIDKRDVVVLKFGTFERILIFARSEPKKESAFGLFMSMASKQGGDQDRR